MSPASAQEVPWRRKKESYNTIIVSPRIDSTYLCNVTTHSRTTIVSPRIDSTYLCSITTQSHLAMSGLKRERVPAHGRLPQGLDAVRSSFRKLKWITVLLLPIYLRPLEVHIFCHFKHIHFHYTSTFYSVLPLSWILNYVCSLKGLFIS
jgi:hypothetical protein